MNQPLIRTAFVTSRLAEFASVKELTTQTGHGPEQWPLVIVKELSDNGIDAAESIGVAPVIAIEVADNAITVTDNGGGIPPDNLARMLNFGNRVSSNEAYASPTRGRQGNAIQTVLAMPYALDTGQNPCGVTTIESRGVRHVVSFTADALRQTPQVSATQEPGGFVQKGTRITAQMPLCACSNVEAAKPKIVQMAERYAVLNPHLAISLRWNGERLVHIKAANPTWTKWLPTDPTSAHWYDPERFSRLIAAIVAHDQDTGRSRLTREFIATTFRGMARTAAQKAVLDRTGAARLALAALFGHGHNRVGVAALLTALQAETKPVQPADLGVIGRQHLQDCCARAKADLATFTYTKLTGTTHGLPWVIETAFAYRPAAPDQIIITGCNWSPGIRNPFRHLLAVLQQQRAEDYPIIVIAHLACPVLAFTDRGKSTLVLPHEIEAATTAAVVKATARWAKQIKAEERHDAAVHRRREALARSRRVSVKDAVYQALPAAYRKASDNGKLPAHVRQIYYALRNEVQQQTGEMLSDAYVTQTLIPDYIAEHGLDWNIVYDDRGHLIEPHTRLNVGLGTLAVRDYLANRASPTVLDAELTYPRVVTAGPAGNYGALLYVEKEGFDPLIERVGLRERFDIATMSCKGMSVTAARNLVEHICHKRGIPLYVLHDFDKAGMSICSTLSRNTRRYRFKQKVNVIDLGLRFDDVTALGLESFAEAHSDRGSERARRLNLQTNGATEAEIQFLLKRRVELNALTSRQFIDLIERKLTTHGVKKLVPGVKLLSDTYRAHLRAQHVRAYIEDALDEAEQEAEAIAVPATLKEQVETMLRKNPRMRWDEAVATIARRRK